MANYWILRRIVIAKHHPSAVLLAAQLLGVLLYTLLENLPGGRAVLAAFGLVVLGAALQVVRSSPWLTWLGNALALVVVLLLGINMIWPSTHLDVAASIVLAAFYFYAAGALIAYMLQDQTASLDEFYAVGATFTLMAWAFAHAYVVRGLVLQTVGDHRGAIAAHRAAMEIGGFYSFSYSALICAHAAVGERDEALRLLADLEARARREHVPAFAFALAYTGLGEIERAFEWVERGVEAHDEMMAENFLDPLFDPLRGDARYERVLARLGASRG